MIATRDLAHRDYVLKSHVEASSLTTRSLSHLGFCPKRPHLTPCKHLCKSYDGFVYLPHLGSHADASKHSDCRTNDNLAASAHVF